MLSKRDRKKIDAFFGRATYSIWEDIWEDWLVPCSVAAVTAFVVTMICLSRS